jgi:hypothetical protein
MLSQPIGYQLTRRWFDYSREHPEAVTPNHTALYSWLVEANKANGWAASFGCPSARAMQGMGVRRYETFKKAFDDLVGFGFVEVIVAGNNQHSERRVALLLNSKALQRPAGVQLELSLRIVQSRTKQSPKAVQAIPFDLFSEVSKTVSCD